MQVKILIMKMITTLFLINYQKLNFHILLIKENLLKFNKLI